LPLPGGPTMPMVLPGRASRSMPLRVRWSWVQAGYVGPGRVLEIHVLETQHPLGDLERLGTGPIGN
jgi:hypothetical protein